MRINGVITLSLIFVVLCILPQVTIENDKISTTNFYVQKQEPKNVFGTREFVYSNLLKQHEQLVQRSNSMRISSRISEMPEIVKPHKNLDITKSLYKGSAKFLDNFLGDGVLKGKGTQFLKAQEKYGVNAIFLIAVAQLESACGKSNLAKMNNNFGGMRGQKGWLKFKSVDEGIDALASNIKKRYVDNGIVTINAVNKRYAEDKRWSDLIVSKMNNMYNYSQSGILNPKIHY